MKQWILLLVLSLLPAGLGCQVTDRSVIDQASQVHQGLAPAVVQDAQLSGYLQACGDRIIAAARRISDAGPEYNPASHSKGDDKTWMFTQMKFHLVASKTINAFTTGGEHMYIYTALMEKCKTEDELVAVMAHEYAHVYARHVKKGMERQYMSLGAAAATALAGGAIGGKEKGLEYAGYGAALGFAAGQMAGVNFTREDEDEADKLGFHFYVQAGWDPKQFAGFFQTLAEMNPEAADQGGTHPSLNSRVEGARRRISQLPADASKWRRPNVASPQQFAALKAKASEIARTLPPDKSLEQAQELLSSFNSCVTVDDQEEQVKARQSLQRKLDAARPAAQPEQPRRG